MMPSLVPHLLFVLCMLYLSTVILCVLALRPRPPSWMVTIVMRFARAWGSSLRLLKQRTVTIEKQPLRRSSPTN
jgi:hypothetical protein